MHRERFCILCAFRLGANASPGALGIVLAPRWPYGDALFGLWCGKPDFVLSAAFVAVHVGGATSRLLQYNRAARSRASVLGSCECRNKHVFPCTLKSRQFILSGTSLFRILRPKTNIFALGMKYTDYYRLSFQFDLLFCIYLEFARKFFKNWCLIAAWLFIRQLQL